MVKKKGLSTNAKCFIAAGLIILGTISVPAIKVLADGYDINSTGTFTYDDPSASDDVVVYASEIVMLAENANKVITALGGTPLTINTTSTP